MNLFSHFERGHDYDAFVAKYANDVQKQRWQSFHASVALSSAQKTLLVEFTRTMNVLCLAGAWCGDCINQCPIFAHFAAASKAINLRFIDRDEHAEAQKELQI